MSRRNRPVTKDMYWFAHGGSEAMINSNLVEEEKESNSLDHKGYNIEEQKSSKDISLIDGSNSSGPSSLERDDRLHSADKRVAVEERRKLLWEAEQERNDAVMKKHMEREAALEARRNAQRSTISFAFGSSVPRNVDTLQCNHSVETDCMSRSFTAASSSHRAELHNNTYDRRSISPIYSGGPYVVNGTSHQPDSSLLTHSEKKSNFQSGCLVGSGAIFVEDVMSRSMTASISAPRGRRKNDLMPTVPYDRTAAPRVATSSSSRRRSVSMTRLDQLAQPRKHYVEATKANSTASSGTSSMLKDGFSPNRPLSSASEHSGGRAASNVTRRVRSSPRKPRPVSIAGTIPDQKHATPKLHEAKATAIKKTPVRKTEATDVKKTPSASKSSTPKSTEKPKPSPRPTPAPAKSSTPKSSTPKQISPKTVAAKPKTPLVKDKTNPVTSSAKTPSTKSSSMSKKKSDVQVTSVKNDDVKVDRTEKSASPLPDLDSGAESDKNNKRIISEEEAKAALAEKRRLAREQAEREAELERQRQEELRRQEEERLRKEEEEQRKMEEESMRLLEEHRRQEEEKLRKAIEDQEQKKEEERARQEEELRLKAEQDRKAKEEAEKIRLELEEKLRREEEERAERKKRLEKIMSRTRGKSSATSPSGSVSGSDHMDSGENQQEGFSSGANSLESNEGANSPSEPVSSDDAMAKMEVSSSGANSLEANLTYEFSSNDVSLNSSDLMLPASEIASRENSMIIASDKETPHHMAAEESNSEVTPVNIPEGVNLSSDKFASETVDNVEPLLIEEEKVSSEVDGSALKMLEELQNPVVSNISETSDEHDEAEQKELEGVPAFNHGENPSSFGNAGSEKEQSYNEMSELHNMESNQFDTEAFKQTEEVNQFVESDRSTTVAQSSVHSADVDFFSVEGAKDMPESYSHDAAEKFESTLEEEASAPDAQSFPSDHLNSEESFKPLAAWGETCSVVESEPGQSIGLHQDPFSDSIAQDQIPASSNKQEQDFVEQPREVGENLVVSSQASAHTEEKEMSKLSSEASSAADLPIAEEQVQYLEGDACIDLLQNQNLSADIGGEAAHEEHLHSAFLSNGDAFKAAAGGNGSTDNPFSTFGGTGDSNEALESAAGINVSVDNPFSNFDGAGDTSEAFKSAAGMNVSVDNPFTDMGGEAFNSEKTAAGVDVSVDNPFNSSYVSNATEQNSFYSQSGDYNSKESAGHFGFGDSNVDKSPDHKDNITLIKQEGSEKYVGIISSIDNDHFSNDFPNKLNERLTNNLECASTTDESEDSSLDSNLSQVIAPEEVEKDLHNHHQTSNNVTDNPFMTQNHQSSIPLSGVDHYSEFEVYSNGHSVESSKMVTEYGNGILSVEDNIFENVGAMDKKMISSDPFLAKGSSNQISGNPFLMQEEQKNPKVLMTSDFLN